jgi:hypothetical protein
MRPESINIPGLYKYVQAVAITTTKKKKNRCVANDTDVVVWNVDIVDTMKTTIGK